MFWGAGQLLNNVSGYAKPGTMTALMGSSGAGKTTLLDVLANRKTGGQIKGKILLNGHPSSPATFSRLAGYVEQTDIHSPTATVIEALRFSCHLRLDRSVSTSTKEAFVLEIMELLELEPIAHSMIGYKGAGLSTEQAKRLTIGVELVANPAIIFMDEPTSGLDSRAASVVMRAVKNIVATGRTVVCTIHQPSSQLFKLFDNLLLLKKGGETVFFGKLGTNCQNLISHLEGTSPTTLRYNVDENPATYMLNAIGAGVGGERALDFGVAYRQSKLCDEANAELLTLTTPVGDAFVFEHAFAAGEKTILSMLLKRTFRGYWRSPNYNLTRNLVNVVISFLLGSIYWQTEIKDQTSMFSITAAQFLSLAFLGILNFATVLPVISIERAAFYRERAANMYSPRPYNIVIGLVELPFLVVLPFRTETELCCADQSEPHHSLRLHARWR